MRVTVKSILVTVDKLTDTPLLEVLKGLKTQVEFHKRHFYLRLKSTQMYDANVCLSICGIILTTFLLPDHHEIAMVDVSWKK